jgi:hypothetical protein
MEAIAVDVRLVSALLGTELRISPGRALMARVVAVDPSGRGTLNIAGTTIDAELPRHVQAGQELRLIVREATPEKVVLSLSDQAAAPATATVPLPGAGSLRVTEQEPDKPGGREAPDACVLALRYDAPTLGAVDFRFELAPSSLRLAVTLAAGDPVLRAQAGADELGAALLESLGRSVSVTVSARREPIDVYA